MLANLLVLLIALGLIAGLLSFVLVMGLNLVRPGVGTPAQMLADDAVLDHRGEAIWAAQPI